MSKLGLGPVGVTLNVSADDRYLDEAAELEELGYAAIWPIADAACLRTARSLPVATSMT